MACLAAVLVLASAAHAPPKGARSGGALSVLAYNVLFDSSEIEKSLDVIEESDADFVCLRELTPRFSRRFESRLGKRYPHRRLAPRSGTWGMGIASRFPIADARVFEQKPHRIPAMEARATVRDRRLLIACLHLFPPVGKHRKSDGFFETLGKNAELRRKQAGHLVRRYAGETGPVLIVGDMNEGPDGEALKTFARAGYRRSCEVRGSQCGGTFPGATSLAPAIFEIDHILGRGLTFESARVVRGGGSDHFPVHAVFRLR